MFRFIALLVLMVSLVSPALAQVVFTSPVTINASDTTYENQDIIVRGTTVTINGSHTFNSLKIDTNGVITHSPKGDPDFAGGLNLYILTNCTIDIGSRIDVTGKGWPTGQGPGAGDSPLNEAGAGGSYGGEGTNIWSPNPAVYGDMTTLADLGGGENLGNGQERRVRRGAHRRDRSRDQA